MSRFALLCCLILLGAILGGRADAVTVADVVQVTTTSPNGPYGPGATLQIQVVFNNPVDLTGTPQLQLNTRLGGDPIACSTAPGTGLTVLNFSYAVQVGDQSSLLDVASAAALQLNGGEIYDTGSTTPAVLTLPVGPTTANSLSNQSTIVIEQSSSSATVTSISGPEGSDGVYGTNKTLVLTITFSEPVFVNASAAAPILKLNSGASAQGAYVSGSGTTTLVFNYTPAAGDASTNLDATGLGNVGSIIDAMGALPGSTTIPTGTATGSLYFRHYEIDTTPPTIQSIYSTVSKTYGVGQTVPILVAFSEDVQVTGVPTLSLATTPATVVQFSGYYGGGSGPGSVLEFNYVVQGGQDASPLDTIVPSLGLPVSTNGGTIRDLASNDADLTSAPVPGAVDSLSYNNDIVISTFAPTITAISTVETAGTYVTGNAIHILLSFGGLAGNLGTPVGVTVSGPAPTLQLNTGTANKYATYLSNGTLPSILEFVYTIQAGDSANPLDYTSSLALQTNGAVISDAVGNVASTVLPVPGSSDGLYKSAIKVTTPPAVTTVTTSLSNTGNPYKAGTVVPITVTFTQPVAVTGVPTLTLNATGTATGASVATATYQSGSLTAALLFSYTVQSGDFANPLDVASTTALNLSGGTIISVSTTTNAVLTLPVPGSTTSLGTVDGVEVDGVAPAIASITSTPSSATYGIGKTIPISVVMTKPVQVTDSPTTVPTLQLNFQSGGVPALATYVSQSSGKGAPTLLFNYVVQNGDTVTQLDQGVTLSLNGATIVDQAGNNANLTLPAFPNNLAGSTTIAIDTTTPGVVSYLSEPTQTAYGPGQVVPIIVTFTEAVTVGTTGGTPIMEMNTGGEATYVAGSGSDTLLFLYEVQTGDPAGTLDASSRAALVNGGGTIENAAGTAAVLELPNALHSPQDCLPSCQITLNTAGATVTSLTTQDVSGVYSQGTGTVIPLTITFSAPVTVAGGVPTLALNTTPNQGLATYTGGSGTDTLQFSYTIGSGQATAALDSGSSTDLTLPTGTTISDQYGNPAILTMPIAPAAGSLPASATIDIESTVPTTAPSVTSVTTTATNGTYVTGAVILLDVTFSLPVQVTGSPQLELNDAGSTGVIPVATYTGGSGTNVLSFTYTVLGGQSTPQLDVLSSNALQLPSGTTITNLTLQADTAVAAPGRPGSLSSSADLDINPGTSGSGKPLAVNVVGDAPSSSSGCGMGGGTAMLAGLLVLCRRGRRRAPGSPGSREWQR